MDLYDPYFYPDKTVFKNKYEFITCTEAAEHFYNPLAEFNRMNELLKKNGVLAVMTSLFDNSINFDNWYYRRDPTHVIFYSEKTFHVIAKQRNWNCWMEDKNVIFFKK
jgi:2-polyprenyl-3-methyl-5-hydroxy-6-metoxy-1,4-benzoquinol methylase